MKIIKNAKKATKGSMEPHGLEIFTGTRNK
jgi:hypothetical protein